MILRHTRLCLRSLSTQACSHDAARISDARIAGYLQSAVGLTDAEVGQVIEKHPNILDLNLEGNRAFDIVARRAVAPVLSLSDFISIADRIMPTVDFFLAAPLKNEHQQQQQQWGIGLTVEQLRKIVLTRGHMLRGNLSTLKSGALWLLNDVVSSYASLCKNTYITPTTHAHNCSAVGHDIC
jgi:hypothetical protein